MAITCKEWISKYSAQTSFPGAL